MTETPTPQPITRFADRPSPLLDIVRALRSGEKDWDTAKADLLAYPYTPVEQSPGIGEEGYAKGYLREDSTAIEPGSFGELTMAAHLDMIEWDRYMEVLRTLAGKSGDEAPASE